ncbi:MAG: hypothetical protein WD894_07135 [Pirellulales bacterium]
MINAREYLAETENTMASALKKHGFGKAHQDRVIIRSWPTFIVAYPLAAVCVVAATLVAVFPDVAWLCRAIGWATVVVATVIALIGTFDVRGWSILTVLFAAVSAVVSLWLLSLYIPVWPMMLAIYEGLEFHATPALYCVFPCVYILIVGCAWIANRFDCWELKNNELLHHRGPFSDYERYPAGPGMSVRKSIDDPFEWILLGSGRLVITLQSRDEPIVLDNVFGVNAIEEQINHILAALEVRLDDDRRPIFATN